MRIHITKKVTVEDLEQQLFDTQTELMNTQEENQNLGQQLFDLQTQLLQKGVVE